MPSFPPILTFSLKGGRKLRISILIAILFCGQIVLAETTKEEQKLFKYGEEAIRDHRFDAAETHLQTLLTQFPQTEFQEEATLLLAQTQLQQGRWNEAATLLENKLPSLSQEWQERYYILLGETQFKGEMIDAAYKTYETLTQKFAKGKFVKDAQYGMALILLQQQKIEPAQEILRVLQKEGSRELAAKANLSMGYSLSLQKKYDQAIELLTRVNKEESKNAVGFQALYTLGEIDLERKEIKSAYSRFETLSKSGRPEAQSLIPSAFFRMGEIDMRATNWTAALGNFEQVFNRSADQNLRTKCIQTLLDGYPADRAKELADRFEDWADKNANTPLGEKLMLNVCIVWQQAKEKDRAIKSFQNFFKKYPKSSWRGQARYQLGKVFLEDKKHESAASEFQEAADLAEQTHDSDLLFNTYFSLGNLHFEKKDYASAAKAYTRAMQSENGNSVRSEQALYQAANANFLAKNMPEVAKLEEMHRTRFPNGKLDPEFLLLTAEAYRQANIGKAAETWKVLLDKYPSSPYTAKTWVMYTEALLSLGKFKEAFDETDRFIIKNSNSDFLPQILWDRGLSMERLGQTDKAVTEFENLVKNHPKSLPAAKAQLWLGSYYERNKKYADAQKAYELVLKNPSASSLAPEATFFAARAAYGLGRSKDDEKRFDDATRLIKSINEKYPTSPSVFDAHSLYGDILIEQKKYEDALRIFDDLIKNYGDEAHPEFAEKIPPIHGKRGQCLRQLEQNDKAVAAFTLITKSPKADTATRNEAFVELGKTYEKMGDLKAAEYHYLLPTYNQNLQSTQPTDQDFFWRGKGVFEAVRLMENQKRWKNAAMTLKNRIIDANLPSRKEAEERLKKLQSEHADAN